MNIKDAVYLKRQLEDQIADQIKDFEKRTGLVVDRIDIDRVIMNFTKVTVGVTFP